MPADLEMDVLALGAQTGQQCGANGAVLTARVASTNAGLVEPQRGALGWLGRSAGHCGAAAEKQFKLPSPTFKGQWSRIRSRQNKVIGSSMLARSSPRRRAHTGWSSWRLPRA